MDHEVVFHPLDAMTLGTTAYRRSERLQPNPRASDQLPQDEEDENDDVTDESALTIEPGAVPPPLPPSVEEAYRRKCIQLKSRMNEVEEANDASRLRLVRMQRQVEKMRLERAFLLEQLAKRTSTNVEDSEGSPSPPPTVCFNSCLCPMLKNENTKATPIIQPKEKPLRTKRGHRKPSFLTNLGDGRAGSAFIQQGPVTLSPSSDAFSHTHPENAPPAAATSSKGGKPPTNGHAGAAQPQKRARSAFEAYCEDQRSVLAIQNRKAIADGTFDLERHLAVSWREMNETDRMKYQKKYEDSKKGAEADRDVAMGERQTVFDGGRDGIDEDVEMGDDTEAEATADIGSAVGGFTAVNRP